MLTKNWKLGLIGLVALAITAVLTFSTLAERQAPRAAIQMPEVVVVALPETNVIHASQLAGAEAFVYP